jgi:acyl carrier protein
MNSNEMNFLNEIRPLLSWDDVTLETLLDSIEDYDSLSQMTIRAWAEDKYSIKIDIQSFDQFSTIRDIFNHMDNNGAIFQ